MTPGQNEAFSRVLIDRALEASGWDLLNPQQVQFELNTTSGRADYLLKGTLGRVLCVLEAKREDLDPYDAKEQARGYAENLTAPFVILSNGREHWFWNYERADQRDAYRIERLPSREDLDRVRLKNLQPPRSLQTEVIRPEYLRALRSDLTLRGYQIRATQEIAKGYDDANRRKFLLEMATGTGKTLLCAALIRRFLVTRNAERVLFIVDRIELAKQTMEDFNVVLGEYKPVIYKTARRSGELLGSTRDAAAPPDLFSDLFAAADEFLSPRPTDTELEEARNDPDKAGSRFRALKGSDFASESAIVHFLEAAQAVIADYVIPGFEDLYRRLLRDALHKFNLRYRLDEPFTLRFLLPGSFTNLYAELHRLNTGNGHLASLMTDFEKAFDRYARTQDPTDLRTCIGNASKYAEGLAVATCGKPGSLGDLCNEIKDWPHGAVQASLRNLYGFCSDYPGIRHAGNPASVRRELATRDMTLASLLLVSFAGYLVPSLDQQIVLGVRRADERDPASDSVEGAQQWHAPDALRAQVMTAVRRTTRETRK